MAFTPLKVTFKLRANVPIREPMHLIHLDALLAWSRVQQAMLDNDPRGFDVQHDLPLEKLTDSSTDDWVFAASALHYTVHMRELRYWSRKTDLATIAQDKASGLLPIRAQKVSTSSGPWKQYSQFESLIHTSEASAWCIGDKSEIEQLLSRIAFIGKRRNRGYGEVTNISVEEDPRATERVFARAMSWPASNGHIQTECGIKPPYWKTTTGYYPTKATLHELFRK